MTDHRARQRTAQQRRRAIGGAGSLALVPGRALSTDQRFALAWWVNMPAPLALMR
ncbi:MAG TPA: hypothetical protein VNS79_14235 [Sphingobium sp.]|nr:hypothetical protein [Sphingobium sp.]